MGDHDAGTMCVSEVDAHMLAIEHAELVVALCAAVTALDSNGLHRDADAARSVLIRIRKWRPPQHLADDLKTAGTADRRGAQR